MYCNGPCPEASSGDTAFDRDEVPSCEFSSTVAAGVRSLKRRCTIVRPIGCQKPGVNTAKTGGCWSQNSGKQQ